MYVNGDGVTYFDRFGFEYFPKNIKNFIENSTIITNIYRIQAYNLIMFGCFYLGFADFKLKGKILLDSTNWFSPNVSEKNDEVIPKYPLIKIDKHINI